MFTGIIQSIGLIKKIESLKKDARITIAYKPNQIKHIILDCSSMNYIDSQGINAILQV